MSIRVLMIEDDDDDALLSKTALTEGGLEVEIIRVVTAERLIEEIHRGQHDVVISDFNLPGLNGNRVLEIVKDSGRDVPVIIVSGSVPEEIIVQTVKAGALTAQAESHKTSGGGGARGTGGEGTPAAA
jgi:DNA-binding NtrC family response regulator